MESSRKSQTTNLLRVISHRLTATPSHQLPHVVPYLANLVSQCRHKVLAPEISKETGPGSEDALLAHKFKTQLSAFLQSKSPEARYAAVVLVKATIESGGRDILQGAGAWVRSLIGIIGVSASRYLFRRYIGIFPLSWTEQWEIGMIVSLIVVRNLILSVPSSFAL